VELLQIHDCFLREPVGGSTSGTITVEQDGTIKAAGYVRVYEGPRKASRPRGPKQTSFKVP
jgi:hypothetical protein